MNREEETLFIRKMQEADKTLLDKHFFLKNVNRRKHIAEEYLYTFVEFSVLATPDKGYLNLGFNAQDEIILAEMDVNFRTPLGLNRSPLELKILAENILFNYKNEIVLKNKKELC